MLNLLLEVSEPMTGSGANNRDVKKINRIRTIRSIFSCDRISQPELAAKVNNSWPTVLQNVKELMAMGLVQEVGTFESPVRPQVWHSAREQMLSPCAHR